MKPWKEMSNKERAEQTYKDIKRKQKLRAAGEVEAKNFRFENMYKTVKKANHSKSRGCRSCK